MEYLFQSSLNPKLQKEDEKKNFFRGRTNESLKHREPCTCIAFDIFLDPWITKYIARKTNNKCQNFRFLIREKLLKVLFLIQT